MESSEPTTAEILAEVERRMTEARRAPDSSSGRSSDGPSDGPVNRVAILAERFAFWLSKHWLALFSMLAFLYAGLPFLSPVLMRWGVEWPALAIHTIYRPLCHQLPQRSFFLFGPQWTYTLPELVELVGLSPELSPWTAAFVGNEAVGYKVALCQRDVAIYGAILVASWAYGLIRRRWKIASLPLWAYVIFGVLPMLLDGGYQFASYVLAQLWPAGLVRPYETTPMMRVITGALFGLTTVWLSYPLFQETMTDLQQSLHQRYGWK
jgi:uncharacterized membrane protein